MIKVQRFHAWHGDALEKVLNQIDGRIIFLSSHPGNEYMVVYEQNPIKENVENK